MPTTMPTRRRNRGNNYHSFLISNCFPNQRSLPLSREHCRQTATPHNPSCVEETCGTLSLFRVYQLCYPILFAPFGPNIPHPPPLLSLDSTARLVALLQWEGLAALWQRSIGLFPSFTPLNPNGLTQIIYVI